MSTTREDWAIAKCLVREWLLEKGVALTGTNGEVSRSTVNRFKLDLEHRLVVALQTEREAGYEAGADALMDKIQSEYLRGQSEERKRCAGIADSYYPDTNREGWRVAKQIAAAIREGKPQE